MAQRRVVITGIGAISSLGIGAKALWEGARDGRSACMKPPSAIRIRGRIKIAAQVQDFDATLYLDKSTLSLCDR